MCIEKCLIYRSFSLDLIPLGLRCYQSSVLSLRGAQMVPIWPSGIIYLVPGILLLLLVWHQEIIKKPMNHTLSFHKVEIKS